MMDERSLHEFLEKYAKGRHTEQEHQLFINWLNSLPKEQVQEVLGKYQHIAIDQDSREPINFHSELIEKIESKLDGLNSRTSSKTVRLWPLLQNTASIAAILFIGAAFGIYFWMNREHTAKLLSEETAARFSVGDLSPGGNKAVLTLADGSKIVLDDAGKGVLATQAGISIRKDANGHVIYDTSSITTNGLQPAAAAYNTITTPRGGQYQIVLPDGSKVWLNAASSLKFPASFSGKERAVELIGEAYFEVAKNKAVPFKVTSGNQTVEVLGTHFNINAYADEPETRTTLLEGSVRVTQTGDEPKLLRPGQQARTGAAGIQVSEADVNKVMAWKNGYFIFTHEGIESIMRQVSRWYDADIDYKGKVTREKFTGTLSRFENISELLNMLELTGAVHFKVDYRQKAGKAERRVTVMP